MLTGKFRGSLDRILLGAHRKEVIIPAGVMNKWKEVIDVVTCLAEKNGHEHGGECLWNGHCSYFMMGMDCPEDCGFNECKNTLFKDGITIINVDEAVAERQVRVTERIRKGTQIGEYGGILVPTNEYRKLRELARERKAGHMSAVDYINGEQLAVVAREYGTWTRLLTHSCQPNVATVWKMGHDRVPVIRVFALRDIEKGEILTYDFAKERCNQGFNFVCLCGKHKESGEAGGKSQEGSAPEVGSEVASVVKAAVVLEQEKTRVEKADSPVVEAGSVPVVDSGVPLVDAVVVQEVAVSVKEKEVTVADGEAVPAAAQEVVAVVVEGGSACETDTQSGMEKVAVVETGVSVRDEPDVGEHQVLQERRDQSLTLGASADVKPDESDDEVICLGEVVRRQCVIQFAPKLELPEVASTPDEEDKDVSASQEQQPGTSRSFYGAPGRSKENLGCREDNRPRKQRKIVVRAGEEVDGPANANVAGSRGVRSEDDVRGPDGRLRKFICKICKKGFLRQYDLRRHGRTHEKDKQGGPARDIGRKFPCKQCSLAFKTAFQLNRHMLKHNGNKDFHCTLCSGRFSRNDILQRHVKNVHNKQKKERGERGQN